MSDYEEYLKLAESDVSLHRDTTPMSEEEFNRKRHKRAVEAKLKAKATEVQDAMDSYFGFNEIPCVQCGFCCEQGPCPYTIMKKTRDYQCEHLAEPNAIGQRKCKIYDKIRSDQELIDCPMMGSGCTSSVCNTKRDNVLSKLFR